MCIYHIMQSQLYLDQCAASMLYKLTTAQPAVAGDCSALFLADGWLARTVLLVEQLGPGAAEPAPTQVEELYGVFKEELDKCLPQINTELPGASATFAALQAAGAVATRCNPFSSPSSLPFTSHFPLLFGFNSRY
jgi:hypothetical protein